jgi:dUTPase
MLGLKRHTNKIRFIAEDEYFNKILSWPKPSSNFIPNWWKEMELYKKSEENPSGNKVLVRGGISNASPKKCPPMLDAITSGYIIPLWSDVQISSNEGDLAYMNWRVSVPVFEIHGVQAEKIGTPPGYCRNVFKYRTGMYIQVPKGYSVLVVPPLGYRDLPVQVVPGVIDADQTNSINLLLPCWIKSGYDNEIVERDTPIAQIIPFRREDWKMETDYMKNGESQANIDSSFGSTIVNHYMRKVRQHKSYK